jgi:hypothetical protein
MATIVVAGGSGLLGTALVDALRADGHQVAVFTRRPRRVGDVLWSAREGDGAWTGALGDADAVINLAGSSVAAGRWTLARKTAIRESRFQSTRALVRAIAGARRPPPVFLSGSAVGIYGLHGDEPVTEETAPGPDFLASVCREWEELALGARTTSRVVLLRTGIVLAGEGGALPRLALPFRFFAGGPAGSGQQYMPWIHRDDWVAMVRWALDRSDVAGPINLTAPFPVRNEEFARALGRVLHRPSFLRAPSMALRLALGEMADALILGGQRVLPRKAQDAGFVFRYPTLDPALQAIYPSHDRRRS